MGYPETQVDCLISELYDELMSGNLTEDSFTSRVEQFKNEVRSGSPASLCVPGLLNEINTSKQKTLLKCKIFGHKYENWAGRVFEFCLRCGCPHG